jgi:phosphoinositide-3-kinase regulatory subunit 4
VCLAQDVFSAGCVLAELFLDGRALFDLGALLDYQRGQWDPAAHVS